MSAGQHVSRKTDKLFFDSFFANYFYKLARSSVMGAFAELVNSSAANSGYEKWQQQYAAKATVLAEWKTTTQREF